MLLAADGRAAPNPVELRIVLAHLIISRGSTPIASATARRFPVARKTSRDFALPSALSRASLIAGREESEHRLPMKVLPASLMMVAISLTGCAEGQKSDPSLGKSHTVGHALCLLGFQPVQLREVQSGHHVVEATVNGERATFVLDTGANVTVVHAPFAAQLGIRGSGAAAAVGLGGSRQVQRARLEELRIGSVSIRNPRVVTADLAQVLEPLSQVTGQAIQGIIGQDVMKEHRAVIDVAQPLLYLMEKDVDPAPVAPDLCKGDGP